MVNNDKYSNKIIFTPKTNKEIEIIKNKEEKDEYIKDRVNKLTNIDKIRLIKFYEMIQYTILYSIFGFVTALLFEYIIPRFNKSSSLSRNLLEIIIQLCLCTIAIFYIRKLVKIIPLFIKYPKEYICYNTEEYLTGNLALSFMFLKLQPNLTNKLNHIGDLINRLINK